jgi:signal transduction histidine kinase
VDDLEVATHLYRIAQEAASNAARHGKCRTIIIELSEDDATICLSVKDDGVGLQRKRRGGRGRGRGMGLQTMAYRASIIGGTLSVQPGPSRGTVVSCVVPRQSIDDAGDGKMKTADEPEKPRQTEEGQRPRRRRSSDRPRKAR